MSYESPRLYVGNLPYVAQREDIEKLFAENHVDMYVQKEAQTLSDRPVTNLIVFPVTKLTYRSIRRLAAIQATALSSSRPRKMLPML